MRTGLPEGAADSALSLILKAGAVGILAEMEKRPDFRDPEKCWVAIFGTPGDAKGWGWKFEGHHLSLTFTIVGDKVALTPSFFGSNPAEVREGESKGLRVLAQEEDVARALAKSLLKTGSKEVIFTDKPPEEILTKEERNAEMPAFALPEGARRSYSQQG